MSKTPVLSRAPSSSELQPNDPSLHTRPGSSSNSSDRDTIQTPPNTTPEEALTLIEQCLKQITEKLSNMSDTKQDLDELEKRKNAFEKYNVHCVQNLSRISAIYRGINEIKDKYQKGVDKNKLVRLSNYFLKHRDTLLTKVKEKLHEIVASTVESPEEATKKYIEGLKLEQQAQLVQFSDELILNRIPAKDVETELKKIEVALVYLEQLREQPIFSERVLAQLRPLNELKEFYGLYKNKAFCLPDSNFKSLTDSVEKLIGKSSNENDIKKNMDKTFYYDRAKEELKPSLTRLKVDSEQVRRITLEKAVALGETARVEKEGRATELTHKLRLLKLNLNVLIAEYEVRKEEGIEFTSSVPIPNLFRNAQRSSNTAKLRDAHLMSTQIDNLLCAIEKPTDHNPIWVASLGKAAQDGRLGALNKELQQLKNQMARRQNQVDQQKTEEAPPAASTP